MAVSIKKGATGQKLGVTDFLQQLQKDFGEEIGSFGGKLVDADRIPTGLFPLDLALAGGFPRGSASTIYGPESSGKTNIVLRAIAMHQLLWPDDVCVFFDIENAFDPAWARRLGVNTDKLVVIQPNYGEQMVDMAESALLTEDCGIVAIDSLAAILTTSEATASAERANPGGNSILIGKLVRKTTNAMMQAYKRGRKPTLLYVNQSQDESRRRLRQPRDHPWRQRPGVPVERHPARLRQEPDGHEGVRGHAGRQGHDLRPAQVEVPGAQRRGQVHDGDPGARRPEGRPVRRLQHGVANT